MGNWWLSKIYKGKTNWSFHFGPWVKKDDPLLVASGFFGPWLTLTEWRLLQSGKALGEVGKKYPDKKRNASFSVISLLYADYSQGKCPWELKEKLAISPSLSPRKLLLSSSGECNSFQNMSNLGTDVWCWETQMWGMSTLISYCALEKPIFVQRYSIRKI